MSGFFSLGGKDHNHHHHHHHNQPPDHATDTNNSNNNSSLFLFKNEEIYNKGFELWQQYYQLHQQRLHHNHHHNHHAAATIQDVDFTVGPSRRNYNNTNGATTSSIFGADIGDDSENYSYRSAVSGFRMMRQGGGGRGSGEGINCQDCGNQAKKDCAHMRCRTCCKSRGFPCQTHVKSTWVPAAKRRERQQQLAALQQEEQQMTVRGENPKRLRESPHGAGAGGSVVACTTSSRLAAATTSGFESAHFPPEVNSSAVFRCVKVSAMDDAEEHLAYQTAVNISGHVFRGILYDQGPEGRYSGVGGEGSSAAGQQPLDLITAAAASSAGVTTTTNTNLAMMDPATNYPTPLSAFMAGTQFFPPPRS